MKNLVFMAGSEAIGSANQHKEDDKSEARNAKFETMTKIQMFQNPVVFVVVNAALFLAFGHLKFEFVSANFIKSGDIRNLQRRQVKSCPLGLPQSRTLNPDTHFSNSL